MTVWLISANGSTYDHAGAFNKWGYVDWKQSANYAVGDTIYIYATSPDKRLRFKTVVEKIGMSFEESEDDTEFWKVDKPVNNKYARLKLIKSIDSPRLSLEDLYENGLKQAPQGAMKLNGNLLVYIESELKNNDITTSMKPLRVFDEGGITHFVCPICEYAFKEAPRCPECGQRVEL